MQRTSIIIPTYNGLELLEKCIQSIRDYTEIPYEIIVVDNGSTDGTVQYCIAQKLQFISLPRNMGFPVACNFGMRIATGDALLLLNNDVIVSNRWLSNLMNCLYSSTDIGIVGPITNYASGPQQVKAEYQNLEQFQQLAIQMNVSNAQLWQSADRLIGFCFLFKRELISRVGYLDEQFSPGHYEDDDYCYRARQSGYKFLIAGDTRVHHYGSVSFHKQSVIEIYNLVHRNYYKFTEKWGKDPFQFSR